MADATESLQAGTITRLETQQHDDERVSVFIDDAFAFGVHQDIVLKHGLHVGQALSRDEQRSLIAEDQLVGAKQRAMDYLAHKPRTETEVRRKLRREDYHRDVIDDTITRLHELGYLDDESYARDYVRGRFQSKGYGPVRVKMELKERGVDRHVADRVVSAYYEEADTLEVARQKARKRWGRLDDEEDPRRRKQKLYRYLKRRGYTYDTIRQVVDEVATQKR
jgi:regulatory protein